ncbi:DUF779 domain-containing protein [Cytophagaceae bacterium DM2B3-1]|uniref:DUF779 domain-containing protein n=1 Tax=Xanthocytophaga flava TaxID=3048013 RepID=A0ABT7CQ58_9BACT|nr:DUF779 domain-containing protein [Xanthocytophaga flavus]MDJ1467992.1 DUF779 domain-containing protein [Xanthocytophaga flavus]MDJ1495886.1 DUF779 domain-containing protein [Xanthocytophaga flavus]
MEHIKSSSAAESRETVARVSVTDAAAQVIDTLREKNGELMFHQSGGCCDGSQPMCFAKGEFRVGSNDVWIGTIHGCDFFMNTDQFEYWKHTHLTIDITPGRGSSFSLEIPLGLRFIVKSRLFTAEESENLPSVLNGEEYLAQQK